MKLSLNCNYFKSLPGILKIVEFVFLIIAAILMITFNGDSWKVTFFIAAYIISAVIILVLTILHMLEWTVFSVVSLIEKKVGKTKWNATLFIIHLLLAIVCVVPAGIMADEAKDWDKVGLDKFYPTNWKCLISALVFGFLSFAMLLVDAILCIRNIVD